MKAAETSTIYTTFKAVIVIASAVLFFLPVVTAAAPNSFGETGLVEQPLATTLTANRASLIMGMRYYDFVDGGDFRMTPLGFGFGYGPRTEVGMSVASYPDSDLLHPGEAENLRVNYKYRFLNDVDGYPAAALSLWGDNLLDLPGSGALVVLQKEPDGFQVMASGGFLYKPDNSYALGGMGFERRWYGGIDLIFEANYAYPIDSDRDQRLRVYPGMRWFITPRFALIGTVGGGLDGNDPVGEAFVGIIFTSHDAREILRAKVDTPEGEAPIEEETPPEEEVEPYNTPRPQFKLRIPPVELPERVTS